MFANQPAPYRGLSGPSSDFFWTRVWCIPEFGAENKSALFQFLLPSAVLRVWGRFQNPCQTSVRTKLRLKRFPTSGPKCRISLENLSRGPEPLRKLSKESFRAAPETFWRLFWVPGPGRHFLRLFLAFRARRAREISVRGRLVHKTMSRRKIFSKETWFSLPWAPKTH